MAVTTRRVRSAIILASIVVFPAAISRGTQENPGIRGFAPAHVAAERALEQKLRAIPDPARAESNLRHLTSEPHMAGTEASHRVAEWLRDQYRSYGFDADIVTLQRLACRSRAKSSSSSPRRTKSALASPEQPFAEDPDTYDKRVVVGFNAYLAFGRRHRAGRLCELRHAGGLPRLESLGISVEGKIVIARYGQRLSRHQDEARRRAQGARPDYLFRSGRRRLRGRATLSERAVAADERHPTRLGDLYTNLSRRPAHAGSAAIAHGQAHRPRRCRESSAHSDHAHQCPGRRRDS